MVANIPSFAGKTTQKAAVCHGALDLRVVSLSSGAHLPLRPAFWLRTDVRSANAQEDKPVRAPKANEVQVAMGVTGLCGSDREYQVGGVRVGRSCTCGPLLSSSLGWSCIWRQGRLCWLDAGALDAELLTDGSMHGARQELPCLAGCVALPFLRALQLQACCARLSSLSRSSSKLAPLAGRLRAVHYYVHGANGTFKIQDPLVLGHESCGIVTALPEPVPANCHLKVGDRVALEVGISCRICKYCKDGRYNLCTSMRFCSSAKTHPHLDGTLCEVMNHPFDLVHKLPQGVSMTEAALAEPLSVVLHAVRRAKLAPASRVLVLGAGAVGLLAASLVKACGASTVVAVDIEQAKLDFAKQMGWADFTYTLPKGPRVSGAESLEAAKAAWETMRASEVIKGSGVEGLEDGFDAVFECTGVEVCMQMACYAAATGGKVMFVGMGTANMLLPASACLLREVDLHGVFRYANTYPEALALLGSGKLGEVSKMVTHRYPLDRAVEAFEAVKGGRDADGKPVIKVVVGNELE